jgi:pimeloyl-ACP methyl ester carboxylesterase
MEWRVEERKVHLGSLNLRVLDVRSAMGDGNGRTLLMLHSLGAHGDAWLPLVTKLDGIARIICPDLRGHGNSDWSRDGYWLHDYATDVYRLLDRLGVTDVGVVGHSLGARVSMVLSPMLGLRLRSLALLDGGPEAASPAARDALVAQGLSPRRIPALSSEEKLRTHIRRGHPAITDEQMQIRARSLYRLNWAGKLVPRTDPEVYWLLGDEALREVDDTWQGLRSTHAPTVLLRASRGSQLDDEVARRMIDEGSDVSCRVLPVGHDMHYEDPALVADVLNDFHSALIEYETR